MRVSESISAEGTCWPKKSTKAKLVVDILLFKAIPSSKSLVSKFSNPNPTELLSCAIAVFNSDMIPDVEVSQNISSLDTVGFVSKIAKFFICLKGPTKTLITPNWRSAFWEVVIWPTNGFDCALYITFIVSVSSIGDVSS